MEKYVRDKRSPKPKSDAVSRVMSSNRSKNSTPEILLRQELWRSGIRGYRLHLKSLPGRPDITFIKQKLAVFVNGCFWHRCPHCNYKLPKHNTAFWQAKFNRNIERDARKIQALADIGWQTIVLWECEIKSNTEKQVTKIKRLIYGKKKS